MTFVRYHVRHETLYEYDQVVGESHHLLRLTPRTLPWQRNLEHHLAIAPEPSARRTFLDSFGNWITAIHYTADHDYLKITSEFWVELRDRPKPSADIAKVAWEAVRDSLRYRADRKFSPEHLEASAFRFVSPNVPIDSRYAAYARDAFHPGRALVEAADALMRQIHRDFSFDPSATETFTPVEEAFQARRGVCQDFSHIMIACLRSIGLAARYMSGYILTHPPEGKARLVGADATHAWVAVFVPDFGWLELDPTNALWPGLEHITLGWGRDFSDITPMRGVLLGGGEHEPEIAVTVVPEKDFASLYASGGTYLEELSR
ncbi:transglutaminase family protein [Marinobacter sp. ANT_B65]|uniref:transglutaminase family protein n=1 Tax=Marinobacter sp. ANT_B65 TaxID=2039467 RepID=UPI000BBE2C37|nr:transglutaminase family protein [Marinobacter sp. ANT_B65]PCM43982.1 transglutaminase [Marinobacter sp. ANT_B65]